MKNLMWCLKVNIDAAVTEIWVNYIWLLIQISSKQDGSLNNPDQKNDLAQSTRRKVCNMYRNQCAPKTHELKQTLS